MVWLSLLFGIVVVVVGFLAAIGKFHIFFKEWKRMPEDEKKKIKIKPLCRNIGTAIMLCGAILIVAGVWPYFMSEIFKWAMLAWFVLAIADCVYISKSGHYKVREEEPKEDRYNSLNERDELKNVRKNARRPVK